MPRAAFATAAAAVLSLMLTAGGAAAHDGFENRTGLRSAPVIANDMRQMGLAPGTVMLDGDEARVTVTVGGRPATLGVDRATGAARMLSGDPAAAAPLKAKLGRSWRDAGPVRRPVGLREPGLATPTPVLRPQVAPLRVQPAPRVLRIQPQD